MSVTGGNLYMVSVKDPNDRLEIQFVPKEIPITRTANTEEVAIVGRNDPQHSYSSGDTKLSLELDFYAEEENREDVIRKCRWLDSLTRNNGYQEPPLKIKLVYGKLFRFEVWVVKRVVYRLSLFQKHKGYLPQQAYVTVDLSLDPKYNLKASDMR